MKRLLVLILCVPFITAQSTEPKDDFKKTQIKESEVAHKKDKRGVFGEQIVPQNIVPTQGWDVQPVNIQIKAPANHWNDQLATWNYGGSYGYRASLPTATSYVSVNKIVPDVSVWPNKHVAQNNPFAEAKLQVLPASRHVQVAHTLNIAHPQPVHYVSSWPEKQVANSPVVEANLRTLPTFQVAQTQQGVHPLTPGGNSLLVSVRVGPSLEPTQYGRPTTVPQHLHTDPAQVQHLQYGTLAEPLQNGQSISIVRSLPTNPGQIPAAYPLDGYPSDYPRQVQQVVSQLLPGVRSLPIPQSVAAGPQSLAAPQIGQQALVAQPSFQSLSSQESLSIPQFEHQEPESPESPRLEQSLLSRQSLPMPQFARQASVNPQSLPTSRFEQQALVEQPASQSLLSQQPLPVPQLARQQQVLVAQPPPQSFSGEQSLPIPQFTHQESVSPQSLGVPQFVQRAFNSQSAYQSVPRQQTVPVRQFTHQEPELRSQSQPELQNQTERPLVQVQSPVNPQQLINSQTQSAPEIGYILAGERDRSNQGVPVFRYVSADQTFKQVPNQQYTSEAELRQQLRVPTPSEIRYTMKK